jgi:DNA topoisomerase IB
MHGYGAREMTAETTVALKKRIRQRDLIYVSDHEPGIRRIRRGNGFVYRHHAGRLVADRRILDRIRTLAVPPAYIDVWICVDPRGHLQATGRDARGRKQYRYHPDWRIFRDKGKFENLVAFGRSLPRIRRCARRDIALPGLPRDKVIAAIVMLLDKTLIRVGNESYARENGSYGLTTLRSRHLKHERGRLRFVFRGKSGIDRDVELDDKRLIKIIRRIHKLPGQKLFQYIDDQGFRQPIDSTAVNQYLREAARSEDSELFTAKNFRTWGATLLAAKLLARQVLPKQVGIRARKRVINDVIKEVAATLGNTPAVCRSSYIDPPVVEGWLDGGLRHYSLEKLRGSRLEAAVLRYLKRRHSVKT